MAWIAVPGAFAVVPAALLAQNAALPDAPGLRPAGTVRGTVTDSNGGTIAGATITLQDTHSGDKHTAVANASGFFSAGGIPAGTYTATITADGFGTVVRENVAMPAGEDLDLVSLVLTVAATSSDVSVTYTRYDVAEEQIHAEEKQRVLGIFPSLYTSYIWNAEPLSPGQKFQLASRSVLDPTLFAGVALAAGIEQQRNIYPGFGGGVQGYASRYGASYGDRLSGILLGDAVFPILFRQDPRYFYKGTGTTRSRAVYALTRAVITRGDNGKWQPHYSNILGDLASGAISNLYYPATDRHGAGITFGNAGISLGFSAIDGLLREFVYKGLTTGGNSHLKP